MRSLWRHLLGQPDRPFEVVKPETEKLKYFLYARKSTESEDRQALSIDSQVGEMNRLAELEGLGVVETLKESRSAKDLGREVFNDMMQRIERGEAQGILCWKLDRLARNFIDGGRVIQLLQQGAIRHIRTYERSYYPQDNVLLMSVEFGMANQYSRDLSVNVTRGLRRKAELGWYPVQPPLGYVNNQVPAKGQRTIITDGERFPLVRKIFDLVLTGTYSVSRVLDAATGEWGLRTRRGKRLSLSNVYEMLGNPFYYGVFEFPRGSGNWYRGLHERMITEQEYERVQVLLGRKGRVRPKTHNFAFTGVIRCAECNSAVTAEEKVKYQKNGKTHRYVYYHCTKKKNRSCAQSCVEQRALFPQIVRIFDNLDTPEGFYRYALKWFREEYEKEAGSRNAVLAAQQKEYAACVRKLDRLIEMRAADEIDSAEFAAKRGELLKEKARQQRFLNETDRRVDNWLQIAEDMLTFIEHAKDRLQNGTEDQKRQILMALGSNHLLEDRKLAITLQKPLVPWGKAASAVAEIHASLEPVKNRLSQPEFERIYARSPIVSALLEDVRTALRSLSGYSPFRIVATW